MKSEKGSGYSNFIKEIIRLAIEYSSCIGLSPAQLNNLRKAVEEKDREIMTGGDEEAARLIRIIEYIIAELSTRKGDRIDIKEACESIRGYHRQEYIELCSLIYLAVSSCYFDKAFICLSESGTFNFNTLCRIIKEARRDDQAARCNGFKCTDIYSDEGSNVKALMICAESSNNDLCVRIEGGCC